MRENRDFVVPVNILTTFARAPFSWAARHTTMCLDNLYITRNFKTRDYLEKLGIFPDFSIFYQTYLYVVSHNQLM